ncbi:hypothetical protein BGZ49_003242 [Haplosporangium sp. Z 27]|nr:hypothetical protein BGZ49_003242 [Haplosporangium sp. Z 27]
MSSHTSQMPISEIFVASLKGSKYFLSKKAGNADAKEYVIFRKHFSLRNPAEVAKEWNGFMKRLKNCDSSDWRDYAMAAPLLTRSMVLVWSREADDGVHIELDTEDTTTNESGTNNETTSTSETTDSNQSSTKTASRLKRDGSTRSAKRKKQSFTIYIKEPTTMDDTLNDQFEISDPSQTSSVRTAFRTFQKTSRKLVLPSHDISSLVPEALSLNGIWWVDKASLSLVRTEYMKYLESLRSMYSPAPDRDLQLLCFDVQSKLQSPQSEEQLMDYMQGLYGLYGKSIEKKQAVCILQRLAMILPACHEPEEEHGETGFILTHVQCFLDVLFGQRSCFPISYNIEHDSGNSTKPEHDHGARSDFFIEVPCPAFSSISNSEIVGLFGEVKPPEKDRRKCIRIQDFWKLVRMAKDEINSQISKGVVRPMVILIQVFGFQIEMFLMKMDPDEGLYVLYKAAEGFLPRSISDMAGIGNIISIFMLEVLLQEFQDQLNGTRHYSIDVNNPPELQKFVKGDIIFPE